MKTVQAFITGMVEFQMTCTTAYDDLALLDSYDRGREWMHRITLRKYEP